MVSWGRRNGNRTAAISALFNVLAKLKDLDGYTKRYEQRVAKTGLDAPLIRKGLGAAYGGKSQWKRAIVQFIAARELEPNDADIHKRLLAAYDALGDADKTSLLCGVITTCLREQLVARKRRRLAVFEHARGYGHSAWACADSTFDGVVNNKKLAVEDTVCRLCQGHVNRAYDLVHLCEDATALELIETCVAKCRSAFGGEHMAGDWTTPREWRWALWARRRCGQWRTCTSGGRRSRPWSTLRSATTSSWPW